MSAATRCAAVLAQLVEADGAILCWQAEPASDFTLACRRGVILFDGDSDCYVHPDAIALPADASGEPTGFAMREPA